MTTWYAVSANGKLPELAVEVDFTNDPTNAVRVWTDVGADVREISFTRGGRNNELQRTSAGTLSATLNNRHGKYDPTNTASPYYPGVKRMRWIRVQARWGGVTYARWQGLVESWKQEWPGSGKDATVTISAADAFKVLNLFDLSGLSYGSQLTSARVTAVCAAVGLPSSVSTGATTVVASGTFAAGSSALSHLLQIEETENGLLFADAAGNIVFQDRHWRLTNSAASVGTIGEGAGEIPYRAGELDLDDDDVYNIAIVTPAGGTPASASDAASKLAHYERTVTRAILTADQGEALAAAQYLVGRYSDPLPRIPTVEVIGAKDTTKWPVILAAVNSQRFLWKRAATAHTISQPVFVEQISDTIVPGRDWAVTFQLSPALDQSYWILEDATYGLLESTTVIGY